MSFWDRPPPPPTPLGRHRQLSSLAGVHVSPLCLGGGSVGYKWAKKGMGEMSRESSYGVLDTFYNAGGNFIDTAINYDDGESERIIGEWMEERGVRDQMVIATKVLYLLILMPRGTPADSCCCSIHRLTGAMNP